MLEFTDLDGFDWDESNRDKNWIAHQVSAGECEEVFFNLLMLIQSDPIYSHTETRYYVLGQTNINRWLFLAFTVRNRKIRVISAHDMSRKERVFYAKGNS
jgi:uncharacterized DUF497 family protein